MTEIKRALRALRAGQIIGLPTDTVYGIAADPFDEAAMAALFAVKGRTDDKPIPVLGASRQDLGTVALIEGAAASAAAHWPGALTIVVPCAPHAPRWLGNPVTRTIAVRVPDHPVALALLRRSGPLAVTSANRSGGPPAIDHTAARGILGDAVAVYLEGEAPGGRSSTVVDLTGPVPVVLRPGPIDWSES